MSVDFSRPVQTRDGRKVRILCTDLNNGDGTVVAAVEWGSGEAIVQYSGGQYSGGKAEKVLISGQDVSFKSSTTDLVNVPEKIKGWRNTWCYPEHGLLESTMFNSEQSAREHASWRKKHNNRIDQRCVFFEIAQPVEYCVPQEASEVPEE